MVEDVKTFNKKSHSLEDKALPKRNRVVSLSMLVDILVRFFMWLLWTISRNKRGLISPPMSYKQFAGSPMLYSSIEKVGEVAELLMEPDVNVADCTLHGLYFIHAVVTVQIPPM